MNEDTKYRFSELYSIWKLKKEKFENISNINEQEIKFMSNIAHINEKSKEIINNINNKIFLYLFQILSDSDGLIDGRKVDQIDLSEIPYKIKNILLPILEELKEQNETLCADEFLIASQQIYLTLPYDYKQYLMEWYLASNKSKRHDTFRDLADLNFKVISIYFCFYYKKFNFILNQYSQKLIQTHKSWPRINYLLLKFILEQ